MQPVGLTKSHVVGHLAGPDPPHEKEVADIRQCVVPLQHRGAVAVKIERYQKVVCCERMVLETHVKLAKAVVMEISRSRSIVSIGFVSILENIKDWTH